MKTLRLSGKIIFPIFFNLLIVSCTKDIKPVEKPVSAINSKKEIKHPKVILTENSKSSVVSTNVNSQYNSIKDIIQAYGIQPPVDPGVSGQTDSIRMLNMNIEVANYLQRYPSVGYIDPAYTRDPDFVFVTLVYSCLEESGTLNTGSIDPNRMPLWLDCVASAVIGYFDIREVIRSLGSVSIESVWAVTKSLIKRYAGWVGAALLIYHITTDCFL